MDGYMGEWGALKMCKNSTPCLKFMNSQPSFYAIWIKNSEIAINVNSLESIKLLVYCSNLLKWRVHDVLSE